MKEKLVRDNIISFSLAKGDNRKFRNATKKELPTFLAKKLREESEEVIKEIEPYSREKLIEELGDLLDVIDAIQDHFNIPHQVVLSQRGKKIREKGSFTHGLILEMN
jgi:predicted house-cleaning noncanonical NTP pyrophosphatase (MazG superfamily)